MRPRPNLILLCLLTVLALPAACGAAGLGLAPAPKAIREGTGTLALPAPRYSCPAASSPRVQYAAEVLARTLGTGSKRVPEAQAVVRLAPAKSVAELGTYARRLGLPAPPEDSFEEAYVLDCGVAEPGHLTLRGGESGLIYGAYTLAQLLRREGANLSVVRAAVSDWPTMRTRAYTGVPRNPRSPDFLPSLDWFARWRMNGCYYELYGDQGQDSAPQELSEVHRECARRGIALYGQISNWRTERLLKRELCACNPEDLARLRRYSTELLDRGCDGLILLFDDLTQAAVEHPLTCPLCKARFGNLAAAQVELVRPMLEVARARGVDRLIVCPTPYYRGWESSYQGKLDGKQYYGVWAKEPLLRGVQVYHCLLAERELEAVEQAGLRNFIFWYNGDYEYSYALPEGQRLEGLWGGLSDLGYGWYVNRVDPQQGLVPLADAYASFRRLPALTRHAWLCAGGRYAFALWGAYCWDAERFDPRAAEGDLLAAMYGARGREQYARWVGLIRKWYPRLSAPPAVATTEGRAAYVQEMKTDAVAAAEAAEAFAAAPRLEGAEDLAPRLRQSAALLAQTAASAAAGKPTVQLQAVSESKQADLTVRERRVQLSDFWSRYSLRYSQTTEADGKQHRTQWHFGSGLGMTGPSYRNWYDAGFVDVLVDGQSLDTLTPEFATNEGGAPLTMSWQTPAGPLALRFGLCEGGLSITCDYTGDKRPSLAVRLFCIPSAGNWPDMDKYVLTPSGETPHGTPAALKPGETWMLFADRVYDVPREHAEGPCAVYFAGSPTSVQCDSGSYVVQTDATYAPGTKHFSLVVWDLHGQRNAEAARALPDLAARAAAALQR